MHIVVIAALALMACSGQEEKVRDSATPPTDTSATSSSSTTPSNTTQTGTTSTSDGVTYYEDAAPIFADRCAGCHQEGGIGPFALDDYALAAAFAPVIKLSVENRSMPPWLVTDDGTCQTFNHSRALTDQEIETIAAWADEGAGDEL